MKNKLFKIGKPMISLVVAFAVVAVSLFAALPGINLNIFAATVTDTWDGTKATNFQSGSGTEGDPYIIANAEQLAYAILGDTSVSNGKYFKVVDNAVFDMNGTTDITLESGAGDVKLATTKSDFNWRALDEESEDKKTFSGNFDGNGVVIYNLYSDSGYAGLFPYLTTDNADLSCTIKNINIKNSYIEGYHYSGGIVGLAYTATVSQSLNIENCSVTNCYISDNGQTNETCKRTSGLVIGSASHNATKVENCIAADNITSSTDVTGGFIGTTSASGGTPVVKGCVAIGSLPYPTGSASKLPGKAITYENVYTDQADASMAGVSVVATDSAKGGAAVTAMPNLNWSVLVAFDDEYPEFRAAHTLNTVSNGESDHTTSCSECSKSVTETHNLVANADRTLNECVCGYSVPITLNQDTWDGSQDGKLSGSGSESDPYIIATAEQLAYVALSDTLDSTGKYFKVIGNAVFNMNGMRNITLNSTADAVASARARNGYNWNTEGTYAFDGNFDGNGVIIYNIYSKGAYAGLFPYMNKAVSRNVNTFKNITVKASYFNGYHGAGGILGAGEGAQNSTIAFENCAVGNCYMTDGGNTNSVAKRASAAIAGRIHNNSATVNNCLAFNNKLESNNVYGGFIANTGIKSSALKISNSVAIGTSAVPTMKADTNAAEENKLTDYASVSAKFTNVYTTEAVDITGITTLTAEQMSGVAADQNMDLDFDDIWFANTGTVQLQVSHRLTGSANPEDNYSGHTINCTECGLSGAVITNHNYDSNYTCTVCKFVCEHKNDEYLTIEEDTVGNCVLAPNTATICACGHIEHDEHGEPDGHKLVKTDAVDATCATDGNIEYWTCEECGNIFLSDDKMAAMDTAVSEDDVVVEATGNHIPHTDSNGLILYEMDENSHRMICETCKCVLEQTAHSVTYDIHDAEGHTAKCKVCLYELEEKAAHDFGDDNECDSCKWTCSHTDKISLISAAEPDCENDGCYEHYGCLVCETPFTDETGATSVDKSTVIIEKLGHDYIDLNSNGKPVYDYDDHAHWYNCNTCGKGSYAEHTIETDEESYEGVYRWCEDEYGYGCDYSTFDYSIADEELGVAVTATTNAFSKDVITDIFSVAEGEPGYEEVSKVLINSGHESFGAYEISPSEEVAEGGKATLVMKVPDIFGNNATIYFVDVKAGKIEKLDTITELLPDPEDEEKEIAIASAKTDKFGYFAVCSSLIDSEDNGTGGSGTVITPGSQGSVGGDNSLTSPATSDSSMSVLFIIAILASVTVLFVRKAKI